MFHATLSGRVLPLDVISKGGMLSLSRDGSSLMRPISDPLAPTGKKRTILKTSNKYLSVLLSEGEEWGSVLVTSFPTPTMGVTDG